MIVKRCLNDIFELKQSIFVKNPGEHFTLKDFNQLEIWNLCCSRSGFHLRISLDTYEIFVDEQCSDEIDAPQNPPVDTALVNDHKLREFD